MKSLVQFMAEAYLGYDQDHAELAKNANRSTHSFGKNVFWKLGHPIRKYSDVITSQNITATLTGNATKEKGFSEKDKSEAMKVDAGLQRHFSQQKPLDRQLVVYHGTGRTTGKALSGMKPGEVYEHPTYMSTSTSGSMSTGFARKGEHGRAVMRVTVPKGFKGGSYIGKHSKWGQEDEYLINKGQRFRLDRSEQEGGFTVHHVTLLSDNDNK